MAPPRATVEQAVEFLKIHQLRRENVKIYQKVESLQEDIKTLQEDKGNTSGIINTTQLEIEKLKKSLSAYDKTAEETKEQLGKLGRVDLDFHRSISNLKLDFEKDISNERALRSQLEETHVEHETRLTNLDGRFSKTNIDFKNSVVAIEEQMKLKANLAEMASVQERLSVLEETIERMLQNQFKTKVCDSGKDPSTPTATSPRQRFAECYTDYVVAQLPTTWPQSLQEKHGSPLQAQARPDGSPDHVEDFILSIEQPQSLSKIDVAENQEMFQAEREISYIEHEASLNLPSSPKPMNSSLPIPAGTIVDVLLSLRQQASEKSSEYFERAELLRAALPTRFDIVFLTRVVEGMSSSQERDLVKSWLENSGWTVTNLRECINLFEGDIRTSCEKTVQHASTSATNSSNGLKTAQQTNSNDKSARHPKQRSPSLESQRCGLRRSRRIQNIQMQSMHEQDNSSKQKETNEQRNQSKSPNKIEPVWARPRNAKGRFIPKQRTKQRLL